MALAQSDLRVLEGYVRTRVKGEISGQGLAADLVFRSSHVKAKGSTKGTVVKKVQIVRWETEV